jgi:hypothetical protein
MTNTVEGSPKRETRAEAFTELRQQTHAQMERETAERVKTNPKPTEEEINAGAFPELLEPQVREAVFEMRKKGYATESFGFGGETGEVQSIDGYFDIDPKTEQALRDLGVQVIRDEGNGPKYSFLRFSPDEPSLETMKAKWDEVARLLPDRGQQAEPSVSGRAEEFIKQYAPERTDVLQRIGELRERHDRETEEAMAKKETEASKRSLRPFSAEEIRDAQKRMTDVVVEYLKGKQGFKGDITAEEKQLLDNLGAKIRKAMSEHPDTPINLDFSKDQKVYAIWSKLINRMTRSSLELRRKVQDEARINEIKKSIGIAEPTTPQPVEREKFTTRDALDLDAELLTEEIQACVRNPRFAVEYSKLPVGKLLDMAWTGVDDSGYEAYKKVFDFLQGVRTEQTSFAEHIVEEHSRETERKKLTPEDVERLKRVAYSKEKERGGDINLDLTLADIDWKVGERFDAHGIAKISIPNQLEQLITLLEKGIDPKRPFHTAPLEVDPEKKTALGAGFGTAGGTAYKEGSFVILGGPDAKLKDGIKYVLVNDAYYEAVSALQKAYPDVEFIRADEVPQRLRDIVDTIDEARR